MDLLLHRDRGVKGRGCGGRMGRGGRGGRGMIKAFGPRGRGRGRGHDGSMNGFGPMRYTASHFLFESFISLYVVCLVLHCVTGKDCKVCLYIFIVTVIFMLKCTFMLLFILEFMHSTDVSFDETIDRYCFCHRAFDQKIYV